MEAGGEASQDLPRDRLERALDVERGCCPFIGIAYDPGGRRITFTVDDAGQDRVLDALSRSLSPEVAS